MLTAKKPRGATAVRSEHKGIQTSHIIAAGLSLLLIVTATLLLPGESPETNSKTVQTAQDSATPTPEIASQPTVEAIDIPTAEVEPPTPQWVEQTVRSGDNLSLVFKRAGFNDRDMYKVVNTAEHGKGLGKLYPRQTIAFQTADDGSLAAVRHVLSRQETVTYFSEGDGYTSERVLREPEVRETWASGEIVSSLFIAGQEAGLSNNMIMEMAQVVGGVIDFVLDPRKGDTMHLIYEEQYLDGEKFDDGDLIAASFTNQGKTFNAYRYTDSSGTTSYYNEDGVSMKKAFLMAPVDFTRISSNFNMRRLHPIYKTRRPHRGTDYAAPTGTPVYAAGDGRVTKAGYTKANGNYVFIQHGERYVTKYLHLHKRRVKQGQRVAQNQVIGTVGMTGAATGPHLHYEFLVDGVHRNPRTVHKQLPKAKSLPKSELPRFQEAISGVSQQLASLQQAESRVAKASAASNSDAH